MDDSSWYLTNGEWRMGPLTRDEALEVVGRGYRAAEVLAWREGMAGWEPAERVTALTARPTPSPVSVPSPSPFRVQAAPAPVRETAWFMVGATKLIVMCVVTFGFYQAYWFYQQWRHARIRSGDRLWPVPRAVFGGLFSYALFRRVAVSATARNLRAPSPVWCALLFMALQVTVRLPFPFSLLSLFSLWPILLVQRAASAAVLAETPDADPNTRLTPVNWLVVAAFAIAILLGTLGAVLPPPAPPDATPKPAVAERTASR